MRFLTRLAPPRQGKQEFLTSIRSLARSVGCEVRSPKWTSRGALELDFYGPSRADFELFLKVVEPLAKVEFARDLNVPPPFKTEGEQFEEAFGYFNQERYWESHEVLEGIWRNKSGQEKQFLQGLILVCAAFVHHQKGEDSIGRGILVRAVPKLELHAASYNGVDVGRLRSDVGKVLDGGTFTVFRV